VISIIELSIVDVQLKPIMARHRFQSHLTNYRYVISDIAMTKENVVFVVTNKSSTPKTRVFRITMHGNYPVQIMTPMKDMDHRKLMVSGTRMILYNPGWRGFFVENNTIVVGDVWNQDSVPKAVEDAN
jgi:hypothetical protein